MKSRSLSIQITKLSIMRKEMYMNNILQYQFDLLMIILRGRDTLSTINQFIEKIQIKKKNSKFSFDENIADKW